MITTLQNQLKNQTITSESLVEKSFRHIDSLDRLLQAVITPLKESALAQAKAIDEAYQKGADLGPYAGIPITLKDNINLINTPTTCASKILDGYTSPYTATAVQKTLDAGLIPVAKVNLDEFAMGSSTENSALMTSKNPWDIARVPGGSSGGSAASVAAGYAPWSLGSDTGGSIRQPAAYCGIVGLKPTYGRVSRFGLVAFASSLDQIGPMTTCVEDAAHLLNIISGHDTNDSTSATQPVGDFTTSLKHDIKGLKIAVPKSMMGEGIDADIKAQIETAITTYQSLGATVDMIDFDEVAYGVSTYYIIAPAEASTNLSRFDGVRYGHRADTTTSLKDMISDSRGYGFGSEVKRRIMLGTFALSSGYYDAYYLKAQKARQLMVNAFNTIFSTYDMILSPTTPTPAFKCGEHTTDPMAMYVADICTIPANLAGLPAISIPCGFSNGLPIGLQLTAPAFQEEKLLNVAYQFEQSTDFHTQKAPLLKELS